jgi:selenocysteine-specific elongation factor
MANGGTGAAAIRHVIIGTAGHVDHGKTTLIRALTGIDTDRLAEEKARGMTIDLGFAHLALPGDPPIQAGIVDVPGHERFVKNMLAGAGGVDVALVVVAADEGPMPQTREHLDILTTLGVARGVVALTKTDLADDDLRAFAADLTREALEATPLKDAPLVPVSAETGAGMDDLRAALARVAADVPARSADAPFRLPVDRVFTLPGVGTVVTGTLVAGTLSVGDAIAVQPQDLSTRARALQTHKEKVERAEPGMRVAVNLPGIEVGQIERGAVLCPPGTLAATPLFDVHLSVLPSAHRPLRHRERVRLHLGTGEVLARLLLLDGSEAAPGARDVAVQLLCETPAAPARGERFVVRTYSPSRAIGGGVVLDPAPARRYRRGDEAAQTLFEARGTEDAVAHVYAALAGRHADFTPAELAVATETDEAQVGAALETLAAQNRAVPLSDGRWLSDVAAARLRDTARRVLAAYHKQNPLRKAMPREGLRAPLAKAATVRDFNAALAYLASQQALAGEGAGGVRLPEHDVAMPPGWQKAADEILAAYEAADLTPPSPDNFQANLPRDVNVRAILNILAENGQLVRIADDLYVHATAMERVKETIRRLAATPDGITVGTVRDATGSSRKFILPLLEYLDAQRFTRRQGDNRVLAGTAATA